MARTSALTSSRPTNDPSTDSRGAAPQVDDPDEFPPRKFETLPGLFAQPEPTEDAQRLATAGIRKLEGEHLTLFTDVPAAVEVDELPEVFDLALSPWCEFFRIDPETVRSWKMIGYLMERQERFQALELLPEDLPPFLNGYQRGRRLWLYDQPSAYYRRHLLLHEGTHAFMQWYLEGMGPSWYAEAMAELMATHRWKEGSLQLAYFPKRREEVDHWGRIKIVQTEYAADRGMSLEQIASYGPTAHLRNEPYGWCWAAGAFLYGHPEFSPRFRQLSTHVRDDARTFAAAFHDLYRTDQRRLAEQWQLFVANLDYGYDLQREALVYAPVSSRDGEPVVVEIRADRGWQSTGVHVTAGTTCSLQATGRYQVASEPQIWWCEPGGVTIEYHRGMPLGILLAGVSDQTRPLAGVTPLARPQPIGLRRELRFTDSGTLFLRINESPAQLADNAGRLQVEIRLLTP